MSCPHAHGHFDDEYAKCDDCGQEFVQIGGAWFEVEAWMRVGQSFLEAPAGGARGGKADEHGQPQSTGTFSQPFPGATDE